MNKHKKVGVYHAERIIALGTGEAEGSVMVLATRFNKRVAVLITPEFMGELAKVVDVDSIPGATPQPAEPQPVVDATYDDEPSQDPDPTPRNDYEGHHA